MREYCCAGIVGPVMKNAPEVVDSSPWDGQFEPVSRKGKEREEKILGLFLPVIGCFVKKSCGMALTPSSLRSLIVWWRSCRTILSFFFANSGYLSRRAMLWCP